MPFDFQSAQVKPNPKFPERSWVIVETPITTGPEDLWGDDAHLRLLPYLPPFAAATGLESYYYLLEEAPPAPPPPPPPGAEKDPSPPAASASWDEEWEWNKVKVRTAILKVGDILIESDRAGVLGQLVTLAQSDGWGDPDDESGDEGMRWYLGGEHVSSVVPVFDENGEEIGVEYEYDGEERQYTPITVVASVVSDLYNRGADYATGRRQAPTGYTVTARGLLAPSGAHLPGDLTLSRKSGNPDEDFQRRWVLAHLRAGKLISAKDISSEFGTPGGSARRILARERQLWQIEQQAEQVKPEKKRRAAVPEAPAVPVVPWAEEGLSTSEALRVWAREEMRAGRSPSAKTAPAMFASVPAKSIRARISEVARK